MSNSTILTSGQEEPRTRELGHTISFGARDFVRFPDEYFLDDKAFDRVHELDGITGYAHQGVTFHGYRGMTLYVLAGKVDFLELMQFCVRDGPLALEQYYRFLDPGYKLTALAGSDFPWCGAADSGGKVETGGIAESAVTQPPGAFLRNSLAPRPSPSFRAHAFSRCEQSPNPQNSQPKWPEAAPCKNFHVTVMSPDAFTTGPGRRRIGRRSRLQLRSRD